MGGFLHFTCQVALKNVDTISGEADDWSSIDLSAWRPKAGLQVW
jgi:hypothetical protein